MKPLIVLLAAFGISLLVLAIITGGPQLFLAGRLAMAAMLLFTAVGHVAFTADMAMMIPKMIPFRKRLVYITGVMEVMGAVCLLIPRLQIATAWLLILLFVALLPANIYAAATGLDYQKATNGGPGLRYLWFRVPLQLLFIAWTYYFGIYTL